MSTILAVKRRAHSTASALVVFLVIFVGIGAITTQWLLPFFSIPANGIEGLIIWGVVIFGALFAFAKYSNKSAVPT